MGRNSEIRLYVDAGLGPGQAVGLEAAQAHYLFAVMRRSVGDAVSLFNGTQGEWSAVIEEGSRKGAVLRCGAQSREPETVPDLWLVFAPIRRARLEMLVEKASEIGVLRLVPVITDHTDKAAMKLERLRAIAVEAAEQSRGLWVPDLAAPAPLAQVLEEWPEGRALVFADEAAPPGKGDWPPAPAGLLIGPEGGFSAEERAAIRAHRAAHPVSLGPRTLRAETAAIVALSRWHEAQA